MDSNSAAMVPALLATNRRILILYGSETGNSQDFANDLEKIAERLRFVADVLAMDDVGLKALTECTLVIFVISTTGQGEMPKNSRIFWKKLLSRRLPPTVFGKVKFTTFGLGDSSYRQYNWAARKLHKRLLQLGAIEFYARGEADERHDDGIEGSFIPWSISMRSHLISEYPLPEGLSPIPEDVELTPKIILERDLVIKTMLDRFSEARARGEDRNGLDCKAARFSHVDVVDADRQEGDLMDKRWWHGSPLYSRLSEQSAAEIQDYRGINYLDRHNIVKDHLEKYRLAESFGPSSAPSRDLLPIPKAWTATIQGNNRLTPDDHWQDVRKLTMIVHPKLLAKHPVSGDGSELNINGLSSPTTAEDSDKSKSNALSNTPAHSGTQTNSCNEPTNKKLPPANQPQSSHMKFLLKQHTKVEEHEKYELEPLYTSAGDTIMIYPKNFPEDVQALIDIMEWNDIADEPFKHYKERNDGMAIEHAPANCYPVTNSTLRQLLTNNYDITAIPKRSFFDDIRFHAQDLTERERLKEFSEARFIDEFYDYTSRPRRSILEILQDFLSVKIPYQKIPMIFPILRGREYSVASAGVLLVPRDDTEDSTKNTRVELLVAMVKYKTVLRKTRRGLSSRYIESLCPDMKINITSGETRGAPFAELGSIQRPLLAIATGTGLAPVRAAFWERNIEAGHGRNALFFGARNRNADFFFEDEWPMLKVKVYTAFSRDQREKIYVQDVIRREYQVVCELIQERATIMVCGSSGKMPVAVREAVYYAMIKGRLVETDDEAKTYLEDNNEYWEEVW